MNNKYPFFKYINGNSRIHTMNSKYKILWFLLSLLINILLLDYISLVIYASMLLTIIIYSKINVRAYLYNTFLIWPIYVLFFIIFYVFFDLSMAVLLSLKIILLIILFLILTFTSSLSEIAWGFECLFIKLNKYNIPVSKISLKIALMIKFIESLFQQYNVIRKSMAYRGVSYSSSKLYTFKKIFIPTILLSYKLSKRTRSSMRLRFYGQASKRTNYHEYKKSNFEKVLIFCNFLIIYLVMYMRWV